MSTVVRDNSSSHFTVRSPLLFVLFVVAGFLGNWFKLELFFDCDLVFGSIFVMLVLLRQGIPAAVVASIIATTYTLVHWNHPWAIIIFTAEILWVGWLHKRRGWDLLLADILYWFTIGLLLVWLLYHNVMDFSAQSTAVVALKQGLNGIFNTLIALTLDLIMRRFRRSGRQLPSFRQLLFVSMLLLVIVPVFVFLYLDIRRVRDNELADVLETTQRMSIRATDMVSLWLSQHRQALEVLAVMAHDPAVGSSQLQRYTQDVHRINAGFQRIAVLDREMVTTAFSPVVLENDSSGVGISLADRHFVRLLWAEQRPFVTDLFLGRIGVPGPRLALAVPLVEKGAVQGAIFGILDTGMLQEMLRKLINNRHLNITLLTHGTVVASTREGLAPLDRFEFPINGNLTPSAGGVSHLIPDPDGGGNMRRWIRSYYVSETAIPAVEEWSIVVESPLRPPLENIGSTTIRALGAVAAMLLVIIAASRLISSRLANVFVQLEDMTRQLPERLVAGEVISWPPALASEAEGLTANFQQMATTLQHHVLQMEHLNQSLEQRVDERTTELQKSHDLLTNLSQQLPGFIYQFMLHPDGRSSVPYASDAITELFEVTPEEVRLDASRIFDYVHPDDYADVVATIEESARTLNHWHWEFRVILPRQGLRWRQCTARPRRLEDGSVIWHGFVSDITRQKRMEQQLQMLNDNLEEMVQAEVSKNREKDQLMITQNRQAAMGEMIGNIAHQWRQPLNALAMVLANISDAHHFNELDTPCLQRLITDGNRLVQKMSSTINDFRNFYKPDKERVPFSALAQANEAISLVESSFRNDNIDIRVNAPCDLELFGFPNEYSHVLLNLLSNAKEAILARGTAGGRVEISLSQHEGKGCVSVRDNGGGIPDHALDRIFEPYFSTKEMGTGVGLYMSKMIIERNMNGTISARNVDGGAEFVITTWLAVSKFEDAGNQNISHQAPEVWNPETSRKGTVDAAQ